MYLDRFPSIDDKERKFYHAMVSFLDDAVGNVTNKLKSEGLWHNTLIIVHSDNGGPIGPNAGANNYPLKGGKKTNFEGGVRVNAFVSGGLLPTTVRGSKNSGLMAGWDWYATLAALAGVDPTDHKAAKAGLPAIESHNLWPLISGQTQTSPRTELALGAPGNKKKDTKQTVVGGLIQADSDGWYKVVIGTYKYAGWTGPTFPNSSFHGNMGKITETCKDNNPKQGCLYDIMDDPSEHVNLAQQKPALFNKMMKRVAEIQKNAYSPDRGEDDGGACKFALNKYDGFWGPFIDVDLLSSEQEFFV
jgi:arylsulfatase I/J